jgi:hypothetical protein
MPDPKILFGLEAVVGRVRPQDFLAIALLPDTFAE